jgi:DNA/RNA-binding domain of Phe-tRNA-synthetase-like protein
MLDSRQVEKTKVTTETQDCFIIIQGNAVIPMDSLRNGAGMLIELTRKYCGGVTRVLCPANFSL